MRSLGVGFFVVLWVVVGEQPGSGFMLCGLCVRKCFAPVCEVVTVISVLAGLWAGGLASSVTSDD